MAMLLIAEKRSRSDKYDLLHFIRNNGSTSAAQMPRQGILSHDLIHFVVESALPLRHGFLSQVARGADAEYVMEQVHGYDQSSVDAEAAQVEAIVEGLQTQLWAGDFDHETFIAAAEAACAARGKRPYDLSGIDVRANLYERALALFQQWQDTPFHKSLSLEFNPRPV